MNSLDNSDDYLDKLLSIFEDELKKEERKEVHEEEDVGESELISLSVDLVLKIAMLENVRDSEMKKAEELSILVVEQEEEFARKAREMQVEAEKSNKALEDTSEELITKGHALKEKHA
ncbi:hypothetical protein QYF36_015691 [Acer negundo]|nr:hypothetical protein QYF36_015691 [Acer negundo]